MVQHIQLDDSQRFFSKVHVSSYLYSSLDLFLSTSKFQEGEYEPHGVLSARYLLLKFWHCLTKVARSDDSKVSSSLTTSRFQKMVMMIPAFRLVLGWLLLPLLCLGFLLLVSWGFSLACRGFQANQAYLRSAGSIQLLSWAVWLGGWEKVPVVLGAVSRLVGGSQCYFLGSAQDFLKLKSEVHGQDAPVHQVVPDVL
eukprot:snap_masked-scaffold_13-processed-gene-9.30-mRNA-1 protein AED:1.00 eAED:1.00 QI:0/0/0/0/1/1/3/0/196